MSLDRFSNKEEIVNTDGKLRGIEWKQEDQKLLKLDEKSITPAEVPILEVHMYTPGSAGRYITGGEITAENFKIHKDEIFIDWAGAAGEFGIERGQFEVVVNVHKNVLGNEEADALWIKEISADRREVWIQATKDADVNIESFLESFGEQAYYEIIYETEIDGEGNEQTVLDDEGKPIVKATVERPMSDDVALNFGENKIFKIINCKDWQEENDFVVRMYQPLPATINEKDYLWVVEELTDAYVDNIEILGPGAADLEPRVLKGPNLEVSQQYGTVTETDFKNWNDLLDANTSTSQQIIDRIFSGSLMGVDIGIDYSAFDNFVHFSSAKERVENFKQKLELIEYYDKTIRILNQSNGVDTGAMKGNIAVNEKRRDQVIGSFDGFERWAYYEPTASLSTHGVSGSAIGALPYHITPFPKFLSGSNFSNAYSLYHTTSSLGAEWFTGYIESASLYDIHNESALTKTIPEHIRRDPNNEQYELFVNMIGHHYDILYSYIENLTRIYKPEDQPKLGQGKAVLYQVAESLGWTLENGAQATDLWKYKLGTDNTGSIQSTGSLFSKSNEAITTEVWRRIVNNLPFLLKTKGTARSIKTLMNTYGIPQTLLSIREYGGPKVGEDSPLLIEDRFSYALTYSGSGVGLTGTGLNQVIRSSPQTNTVEFTNQWYSSSFLGPPQIGVDRGEIPALTREFRFRPAGTGSMLLWSNTVEFLGGGLNAKLPVSHIAIEHTSSYSGSAIFGRVHLIQGGASKESTNRVPFKGTAGLPMTASTDWVPIYDGNFWNLRYYYEATSSAFSVNVSGSASTATMLSASNTADNLHGVYRLQVQQASDYITDKIVHSASLSITPQTSSHWRAYSGTGSRGAGDGFTENFSIRSPHRQYLGGNFGTQLSPVNSANAFLTASFFREKDGSARTSHELKRLTTFTGSMQEYREWTEVIDQKTFDLHTLNPTSYVSSISPTASFDTLVRHYPLGTEMIAVDRNAAAGRIVTSSHPAQRFRTDFSPPYSDGQDSFATASNFPIPKNRQRGNYIPVEETYYVQGVSLGGTLPKSQKIRLENNSLFRMLSPLTSGERSSFDLASLDSNKLGLFYSHADQLNKEIFNHVGDVALDDFVGDPDDEFLGEYPDLEEFSKNYFKKFEDANDVNAYLRVFSQFDFALFRQIKQLLPERVDEAMGLLVEPHALERAKVILTRRPQKEEPMFDGNIPYPLKHVSMSILPLSASIPDPVKIASAEQVYHISASGFDDTRNYLANMSIFRTSPSESADYCLKEIPSIDMTPQFTASINNIFEVIHENQADGLFHGGRFRTSMHGIKITTGTGGGDNSLRFRWHSDLPGGANQGVNGSFILPQSNQFGFGTLDTSGPNGTRHINADPTFVQCDALMNSTSNPKGRASNKLRIEIDYKSSYDTIIDINTNFKVQDTFSQNYTGSMFVKVIIPGASQYYALDNAVAGFSHPEFRQAQTANVAGGGLGIPSETHGFSVVSASDHNAAFFESRDISELQEIDTPIPQGAVVEVSASFINLHIPRGKKPQLELFIVGAKNNPSTGAAIASNFRIDSIAPVVNIKKVCFDAVEQVVLNYRQSDIYLDKTFYYGISGSGPFSKRVDVELPERGTKLTKIGRDRSRYIFRKQGSHRDLRYAAPGGKVRLIDSYPGNFTSASSHMPSCYRDDFMQQTENLFYEGCKLSGPGINVNSNVDAIDQRPVVEVFNVNPNQLIFQRDPQDGVPGNLRVR